MDEHDKEEAASRHRQNGLDEEQALCNEALKSGKYDTLSDAAWISLCEEVAAKGRKSTRVPTVSEPTL